MNNRLLSPSQLLSILALSPNATAIYSGEHIIIEAANDAMLAFWGKNKNVIGLPLAMALPELAGQPFIGLLHQVINTGKDHVATASPAQLVRDGKLQNLYFDFIYKAVPMDDGKIYVLNTASNVTEQVKARTELEQLQISLEAVNKQLLSSKTKLLETDQALQQSHAVAELERNTLSDLFMQAPAGICILAGPDLIFELVNPGYQQLLPNRQLLGRPIFEALPELIGQEVEHILTAVYNNGQSRSIHELLIPVYDVKTSKLQDRYFSFNYTARKDINGVCNGIVCFVHEVTELVQSRKTVEESETYFRQLANLVPAKISNALPTGEVVFLNQQWLDFSGLNFEDTRDFGYHQMMHPDEIPPFQQGLQQAAEKGVPYISEMRFKNTDGEYIWHLNIASAVLDKDGSIKMWIGSTTDIHAFKMEEQRQNDFVSFLSHELKTPVTSLKGYVQLLLAHNQQQHIPLDAEVLKLSLERMDQNVDRFSKLIDEMLNLARADHGKLILKSKEASLNEIVSAAVQEFQFINPLHSIELVEDARCKVQVDADKIGQVLANLLNNAIKYAPESYRVVVKIFSKGHDYAGVSVTDYGIGIAENEQLKIFDRFYRVHGAKEIKFGGFGIGLFLAKTIIETHQGNIEVQSKKGEGSTFTFYLPVLR